ncbi:MAG: protein-disulfide reductase DsbD domain-containing protein, partial [Sulfurovum sp.]
MFGGFQSALEKQKFLSPDEAFKVEVVQEGEQIVSTLTMADKIHIYEETLRFKAKGDREVILKPDLPKAEELDGERVHKGVVTVSIPTEKITSQVSGDYTFSVEFQGCSDAGLCYSPIVKSYQFKGKELGVREKIAKLSKEGNAAKIVDVLINESSIFVLFLFFIFGLLLSLTPCIFPMIPILSSIIVSQQGGAEKPSMAKAFFTSFI